jgi:outer membrane biosynthesis protein TonB
VALSDEQNAMLRLLASGEQGYGDIAALLGLSEDEVRAKVVGALAQLQAEGKPAPDIPPPIAGGAHPAAEAAPPEPEPPAVPVPPAVPEPKAEPPAEPIQAEPTAPKAPVPAASAPKAAPPAPAAAASSPRPSSGGGRTITLPTGGKAWLLGGGILAAIAAIVVIVLLVSGGGSDSSSTTASTEGGSNTAENAGAESGGTREATQAELVAVDGSEAVGLATFGRLQNKLALQIEAKGLEPTTATDAYTIWLAQSPQKMLPLASTAVKGSGKGAGQIAAQFEVPVEILAYLASGTFDQIAITRTETKPFEAAIKVATKNKTTPKYTGEEVLRGTITGKIVGLAKREKEEQTGE